MEDSNVYQNLEWTRIQKPSFKKIKIAAVLDRNSEEKQKNLQDPKLEYVSFGVKIDLLDSSHKN